VDTKVAHWRKHLDRYEPYRQTNRLLEVASGQGFLLKAAVEAGWQATGNDISPRVAERARELSDAPFLVGPIESIELEHAAYDIVVLNNVLEHLESPRTVLQQLTAALRPAGVMYLQTLSGQSLSMWAQRGNWYYFHPAHLYVPNLYSMQQYFQHAHLKPMSMTTHGYRSGSTDKLYQRSWTRRRTDKILANFASATRLGHRVEYLLQHVPATT